MCVCVCCAGQLLAAWGLLQAQLMVCASFLAPLVASSCCRALMHSKVACLCVYVSLSRRNSGLLALCHPAVVQKVAPG